ncbi:uncharacterized protein LOC142353228 [Convolutriloba macropyga]|uniref:uncharacterized protein LOC142353228 n=1 Tax=Convolutriloba macropyga TaxID=536237 RepID=UPI003F522272
MRLTCYDRCSATWAGVQHHVLRERTQMNLKKSLNLIVTFPPKDTLTRAFFTLLVLWVVLVTPHVAFQDKTLHGEMYSVGTLFEVQYSLVGYDNMWHVAQEHWNYDEFVAGREMERTRLYNSRVESALRSLKMSFGFVNSILLIVLMQPFQSPLNKIISFFSSKEKK